MPNQEQINKYINAATRENTRQSYQSSIRHFEREWGGFLPASPSQLIEYLSYYAGSLSVNTLKTRLAGIAAWHMSQGFPDPTKALVVKKVLKGIKETHNLKEKRAKPITLELLHTVDLALKETLSDVNKHPNETSRNMRDRAIFLIGFWRAFRSDELSKLTFENINYEPKKGLEIFLPRTKGDHARDGMTFNLHRLNRLCPVESFLAWKSHAKFETGPVFRSISRWGKINDAPLHQDSFIPIIQQCLQRVGVKDSNQYTSHSLRRGFASWANDNEWSMASLMKYVGWKDVKSSLRYIEETPNFKHLK